MDKIKKPKIIILIMSLIFIFGLNSCSKKSDETVVKEADSEINLEMDTISEDNFTENDEDLLTVDYKEFYDELAPHGEWIEVTDKELGVDLVKSSASSVEGHKKISLSDLFGVKEAFAEDISLGTFFVWKPSPELAVTASAGETEPVYVPYTNGQWTYTDAGWYFKAPTPYEEIVHHYGRWSYTPSLGWVWLPGRVWSPAWVDWREDDSHIAWTPVPPSVYIVENTLPPPPVYNERYVVVEKQYFTSPYVYKYVYRNSGNKFTATTWNRVGGITVLNKKVINNGPDFSLFQKLNRERLRMIRLTKVRDYKRVNYSPNEFLVYSPQFKKVKVKKNISRAIVQPKNFTKYEEVNTSGTYKKPEGSFEKNPAAGEKNNGNKNIDKVNEKKEKKKYEGSKQETVVRKSNGNVNKRAKRNTKAVEKKHNEKKRK